MSKIKHEPKFYVRLCQGRPYTFTGNFTIYPGSIYGRFADKNGKSVFWVCDSYALKDDKLPVHIFNGNYWKFCFVSSEHPCYKWVKSAIEQLGKIPKVETETITHKDCENMMKTYSMHKKGTGSRINTHQINPALKWNEITEIAHWYGKGNASVVACNIR